MSRKPRKAKGKGRRAAGLSPMRRLIIMLGSAAATSGEDTSWTTLYTGGQP